MVLFIHLCPRFSSFDFQLHNICDILLLNTEQKKTFAVKDVDKLKLLLPFLSDISVVYRIVGS